MRRVEHLKCPNCGNSGKTSIKRSESMSGMLEDIPGYSIAEFKCPHCGYYGCSKVHSEFQADSVLVEELRSNINNIPADSTIIGARVIGLLGKYFPGEKITPENIEGYLRIPPRS